MKTALYLCLLALITVACTSAAPEPAAQAIAPLLDELDPTEPQAQVSCVSGNTWCDGDSLVTCVDGDTVTAPCAASAHCNFGACKSILVSLPGDAGPHMDGTEWWYYTGHVQGDGGDWGFELALFQQSIAYVIPGYTGMGYMCHVAITDKVGANHVHTSSIDLEADTWSSDPVVLAVDDCHVELGGDGRDRIRGVVTDMAGLQGPAGQWAFDLELEPVKPVVYHGDDGVITMGDSGGASYYYTYPRMDAVGTVSTPGGDYEVTGQAWMDHQWGDFELNAFKGWDWWSLQLDHGYEVMLFQFRDWSDALVYQEGTVVDPQGNQTSFVGLDTFTITPLRQWVSPHTDGVYPLDWEISLPMMEADFLVETHVDDQEMPNSAQHYWEGCVTVSGTAEGAPVSGLGYVELTGYATDMLDP